MRVVTSFAVALLAVAGAALPASAQEDAQKVGEWDVVSRPQPTKRLDHVCIATSPKIGSDPRLQLVNVLADDAVVSQPSKGAALVNILVPMALRDTPTATLEGIEARIPGQKTWQAVTGVWDGGKGQGGKLVLTLEGQVGQIIPPLAKGNRLDVVVPRPDGTVETLVVDLKGSGRALRAYDSCLAKVTWVAPG